MGEVYVSLHDISGYILRSLWLLLQKLLELKQVNSSPVKARVRHHGKPRQCIDLPYIPHQVYQAVARLVCSGVPAGLRTEVICREVEPAL